MSRSNVPPYAKVAEAVMERVPHLTNRDAVVYLSAVVYANRTRGPVGVCEMTIAELSRKIGRDRTSVSRAISSLARHGYLEKITGGIRVLNFGDVTVGYAGKETVSSEHGVSSEHVSSGHAPRDVTTHPACPEDTEPVPISTPPICLRDDNEITGIRSDNERDKVRQAILESGQAPTEQQISNVLRHKQRKRALRACKESGHEMVDGQCRRCNAIAEFVRAAR